MHIWSLSLSEQSYIYKGMGVWHLGWALMHCPSAQKLRLHILAGYLVKKWTKLTNILIHLATKEYVTILE